MLPPVCYTFTGPHHIQTQHTKVQVNVGQQPGKDIIEHSKTCTALEIVTHMAAHLKQTKTPLKTCISCIQTGQYWLLHHVNTFRAASITKAK